MPGASGMEFSHYGPTLKVRFTHGKGAPVKFIPADDPREAAAVREVDLQRKYYILEGRSSGPARAYAAQGSCAPPVLRHR